MALNNFKCYHLMPLHFKGLMETVMKAYSTVSQDEMLGVLGDWNVQLS